MANKNLSELTAITPLDGRYREKIEEISPIFSEYGLIKNRIIVEVKYLLAISDTETTRDFNDEEKNLLRDLADGNISNDDIEEVKKIEEETRHDVKAVERMLRNKLKSTTLSDQLEIIHIGLTSEDINNLAYRLQLKSATNDALVPTLENLIDELVEVAKKYKSSPMLGRTHGQSAIPTTIGKEFAVFAHRINSQVAKLKNSSLTGKLNGAVGNFNALRLAYPDINWIKFSEKFVASLGLTPNHFTTQINTYDDVVELLQIYQRINSILIGFDQDMWRYISDEWFMQEVKKGEVGSSTMPQKVNPIDFENSEGNLGLANSLIEHLSRKLLISRLQRDLSDSTTVRNYGSVLGYSLIGYKSTLNGLSRIKPNEDKIKEALSKDWSILTEALQTLLRKNNYIDSYTEVKSAVRGQKFDKKFWELFTSKINIGEDDKNKLLNLSPEKYIGLAVELTEKAINEINESRKK